MKRQVWCHPRELIFRWECKYFGFQQQKRNNTKLKSDVHHMCSPCWIANRIFTEYFVYITVVSDSWRCQNKMRKKRWKINGIHVSIDFQRKRHLFVSFKHSPSFSSLPLYLFTLWVNVCLCRCWSHVCLFARRLFRVDGKDLSWFSWHKFINFSICSIAQLRFYWLDTGIGEEYQWITHKSVRDWAELGKRKNRHKMKHKQ